MGKSIRSGIPQLGSVLGPLLFLICINDLIDCCEIYSEIHLFADDAKLFRHILQSSDTILLQSGLNELRDWTQHWLLSVNINKCEVMCNVMMYNVDDFISTQIDTQIGYVHRDVHEFSTTVRSIGLLP